MQASHMGYIVNSIIIVNASGCLLSVATLLPPAGGASGPLLTRRGTTSAGYNLLLYVLKSCSLVQSEQTWVCMNICMSCIHITHMFCIIYTDILVKIKAGVHH